jgi:hypothetical protein
MAAFGQKATLNSKGSLWAFSVFLSGGHSSVAERRNSTSV